MLEHQLAAKYAQAVFQLAEEKAKADAVEKQLESVISVIDKNAEFKSFFYNPGVIQQAKIETLQKVFAGELEDFLLNFLMLVVERRREFILPAIVKEYKKYNNEAKGIIEAKVVVAKPLSDTEKERLSEKLKSITGKNVLMDIKIDNTIMGGVIVKIGDKVIDGSVVRQLNMLKTALFNTQGYKIGVTN